MQRKQRTFDVIVWGATGFTGSLVCTYLAEQYGTGLRWAMAARDPAKLQKKAQELNLPHIPQLTADSFDEATLDAMTSQASVVCSTVGPYALYGDALVASCVRQGTNYCDITGEVHWMRKMIDLHHEAATAKGIRIVSACGFDSIPSDFGVHFIQQHINEHYGQYAHAVEMLVRATKGGLSGGTYASMKSTISLARSDEQIAKTLRNRYALNPDPGHRGADQADHFKVKLNKHLQLWTAPFVMAAINTRVVRRTHALQGFPYGDAFTYNESIQTGPGWRGKWRASVMTAVLGFMATATAGSWRRWTLDRIMPRPGQGPSRAQREHGFFKLQFLGYLDNGKVVHATVTGDRDPGYGSTSRMLGESAVCLALDHEHLHSTGVLTPVTAMGTMLLQRLQQHAGLRFTVAEE